VLEELLPEEELERSNVSREQHLELKWLEFQEKYRAVQLKLRELEIREKEVAIEFKPKKINYKMQRVEEALFLNLSPLLMLESTSILYLFFKRPSLTNTSCILKKIATSLKLA